MREVRAGQKKAHGAARHMLEDLFSGTGRPAGAPVTVLLVDEIDMLLSRDQSVLYNLFGWPQQPGARLVVLGIANTLDLPERLLPKIARRGAGSSQRRKACICCCFRRPRDHASMAGTCKY